MFTYIHNIFTFIIFTFYCFCETKSDKKELRVFQGRDAEQGEFPYVVALAMKFRKNKKIMYNTVCTGSIITPEWTLTAAHCIPGILRFLSFVKQNRTRKYKPVIRYVNLTSNSWSETNIIRAIKYPRYIVHKRNKKIGLTYVSNDIGLIENERTIISMFGKVSSVDFSTLYGQSVMAVGFGLMFFDDKVDDTFTFNKTLQVFEAMVEKCSDILRPLGFCLASKCRKVATLCRGDSGGPIIHPSGIIGVNSLGTNNYCDREVRHIGTITPTSYYINWIKSVINNHN